MAKTKLPEKEIYEKYINGISGIKLSFEYKCSLSSIYLLLKRNLIVVRSNKINSRKYSLDIYYFDIINSEDKSWTLGWLYADGCNGNNTSLVKLSLSKKDNIILNTIKKYLKTNIQLSNGNEHIIKDKEGNPRLRKDGTLMIGKSQKNLIVNNQKITDRLTELGCMPNKSLILEFPTFEQVPEYSLSHFIRGYFEGDGTIYFKYRDDNKHSCHIGLEILGTERFLNGVKNWLLKQNLKLISLTKVDNNSASNSWRLRINHILDVLKFKELIYDNYLNKNNTNSELILQRKYDKFLEVQQYANANKKKIDRSINLREIHKPENIQKMIDMRLNQKMSYQKIADYFKVSETVIRKIIIH